MDTVKLTRQRRLTDKIGIEKVGRGGRGRKGKGDVIERNYKSNGQRIGQLS